MSSKNKYGYAVSDANYHDARRHYYQEVLPAIIEHLKEMPLGFLSRDVSGYNLAHFVDFQDELTEFMGSKLFFPGAGKSRQLKILDLGSWKGEFLGELKDKFDSFIDIHGVDLEIDADYDKRVIMVQAMAEELPYKDNSFDMVTATTTLNYAFDPLRIIEESHRVLREGGVAYIQMAPTLTEMYDHSTTSLDLLPVIDSLNRQGYRLNTPFRNAVPILVLQIRKSQDEEALQMPYVLVGYNGQLKYYQKRELGSK